MNQPKYVPRVVCAANKDENGIIVIGPRHFDTTMRKTMKRMELTAKNILWEQGFIDQHGVFLTRQEAWKIAERNNQIIKRVGGDTAHGGTLYSENLY